MPPADGPQTGLRGAWRWFGDGRWRWGWWGFWPAIEGVTNNTPRRPYLGRSQTDLEIRIGESADRKHFVS